MTGPRFRLPRAGLGMEVHRQPEAGWLTRGPQDAMRGVRGDEAIVTGPELEGFAGDPECGLALKQTDPLVLGLIVEAGIGPIAAEDALDLEMAPTQKVFEDLALGGRSPIGEEIAGWSGWFGHDFLPAGDPGPEVFCNPADGVGIAPLGRSRRRLPQRRQPQTGAQSRPGTDSNGGVTDLPGGIDEEGRGDPGDTPATRDPPLWIGDDRKGEPGLAHEALDVLTRAGLQGDRDHPVILGDPIDGAVHDAANGTPSGPEMDQHRLTSQITQVERASLQRDARQWWRLAPRQGPGLPPLNGAEHQQDEHEIEQPTPPAAVFGTLVDGLTNVDLQLQPRQVINWTWAGGCAP